MLQIGGDSPGGIKVFTEQNEQSVLGPPSEQ